MTKDYPFKKDAVALLKESDSKELALVRKKMVEALEYKDHIQATHKDCDCAVFNMVVGPAIQKAKYLENLVLELEALND